VEERELKLLYLQQLVAESWLEHRGVLVVVAEEGEVQAQDESDVL
jgi:hypothetical protein